MAQIYHFSKFRRDEDSDFDTSFAFKLPRQKGWLHLNRKATQLEEYDDYVKVTIQDWYINNSEKFIDESIKRRLNCELLHNEYISMQKIKINNKKING